MNREQAKLLAPIICAFAAGSTIEVRSTKNPQYKAWDSRGLEDDFCPDALLKFGAEIRIAPKPPKVKEAKLALVLEGSATAIVTKGKWELMEKSPDFLKWISEPFKLLPSDKHLRTHTRG